MKFTQKNMVVLNEHKEHFLYYSISDSVVEKKVLFLEIESIIEKRSIQLLHKAIAFKASDIHIVPDGDKYEIYFRKFGRLVPIEQYPEELGSRMITYLKFLSGLDIAEKRKPQSGSFQRNIHNATYSFRLSTLPSIYNLESIVIRLLLQKSTIPLSQLTLSEEQATTILHLIKERQGLVLISGATGSGKTTTLYSLIHHCANDYMRHVISLEDPVEQTQEKMLQIQVNERAGVSYSTGLKAILRHTPDVIMIGEIRDRDTAKIALEAALTGHLVLSTVHAKSTVHCLYRLLDLGFTVEELKQTIIAILAQTLIEIDQQDERKAIFEVLAENQLNRAIKSISKGFEYELPWDLTLQGQLEKIELMQLEY